MIEFNMGPYELYNLVYEGLKWLSKRDLQTKWFHGGSTYIFQKGNDIDIVVFTSDLAEAHTLALESGLEVESEVYPTTEFISVRKGSLNFIITDSCELYTNFVKATEVCKLLANKGKLSYEEKDLRVEIHQKILYG